MTPWVGEPVERCYMPLNVRGNGTCLRGTPGCPVPHPQVEPLPTVPVTRA